MEKKIIFTLIFILICGICIECRSMGVRAEYPWNSIHDLDIDMRKVKMLCQDLNCTKDKRLPSIIFFNVSNYEYISQFDKRVNVKIYKKSVVFITYSWKRFCFPQRVVTMDTFPIRDIVKFVKKKAKEVNRSSFTFYYKNDFISVQNTNNKSFNFTYYFRGKFLEFKGPKFIYDQGKGKWVYLKVTQLLCDTYRKGVPKNCTYYLSGIPRCTESDVPLDWKNEWPHIVKKELNFLVKQGIIRNIEILNISEIINALSLGANIIYFNKEWCNVAKYNVCPPFKINFDTCVGCGRQWEPPFESHRWHPLTLGIIVGMILYLGLVGYITIRKLLMWRKSRVKKIVKNE